ncbi:MAG: DegT/DnrJ/EryC1/StrS family aminotransferase [Brevinematales bacterium]|nr:DegT/DnrJ/EryC1/StrS family aminotransferase [Brevinematales bacterium]
MNFIDLKRQYHEYKTEIDKKIADVIDNTRFIMGKELKDLEAELAAYVGAKHGIGVASGTDALLVPLASYGVGPGDEVITTPFTFIATVEVISFLGATPVFVDIDPDDYNIDISKIESKITKKTKGIIPVSLYGQTPDLDKINAIAKKHGIFVLEDGAQSFGAIYKGKKSCGLTDVAGTSFYPSKPLGCYGDGGMIFTSDDALAEKMRMIMNHGSSQNYVHKYVGINARMDTVQAAVLLAKFAHFENECDTRMRLGARYTELLSGGKVITPKVSSTTGRHVYAQYSIRVKNRDGLKEALAKDSIPTAVHYPKPIHLQEAYQSLGHQAGDFPVSEQVSNEIISLPMHPFLTDDEQKLVAGKILGAVS